MKYFAIILALGISISAFAQEDNPGSLWSNEAKNPLIDRTARKEGDILTVIISENSAASLSANTTANKSDSSSVPKPSVPFLWKILGGWLTSATSSNSGTGKTDNSGKVTARLTAIVKKVLPNGNLVIEATKSVQVNKDTQIFRLSGIVRRDDIDAANTIKSENIAEADIKLDGKGMISDRQRRGILTRLLDWLF